MDRDTIARMLDGKQIVAALKEKPLYRWGLIGYLAIKDFFHDSGPQWAAAIAYYSLLSTFPLLLAIASISAYFIDPAWALERATDVIGGLVPAGEGEIESIVMEAIEARQTVSLLSIAALLWSGTRVFAALTKAMNIAFDTSETYGILRRTLVEAAMLLTIGLFFILALSSHFLLDLLWTALGFLDGEDQNMIAQLFQLMLPGLLVLLAFFLIYRFVPRRHVNWRAALLGAVVASLLFIAARPLFIQYLNRFAEYNLIYGSLTIAIILTIWAWIVASILLLGGEIASHMQAMFIEGQSPDEIEARHLERSPTTGRARAERAQHTAHAEGHRREASPEGEG